MPTNHRAIFTEEWNMHFCPKDAIDRRRGLGTTWLHKKGSTGVFCDAWQDFRIGKWQKELEEMEKRAELIILLAHGVVQETCVCQGGIRMSDHHSRHNSPVAETPWLQKSMRESNHIGDGNLPIGQPIPPVLLEHSQHRSTDAEYESTHPPSQTSLADCTEASTVSMETRIPIQGPTGQQDTALEDLNMKCFTTTRIISSADMSWCPELLVYESDSTPRSPRDPDAMSTDHHWAFLMEDQGLKLDREIQSMGLDYWARVLQNNISLRGN
ncbi:hypothetical protein BDV27DRAFT_134500 [Aspergillus caelatus]|uniref:Uncharacterized protein n=1 Tax=Aspergillus caelatus TaxID=61420 RepID=A0A5N6ZSU9_9EURO|nr:uncharacterized protein BDV27DRAFT_134500 [Aspergillus caelatus]KAE8360475.1 hypothetical protein BDV27DRAFT_134500 [Aspergillus caelatus]